MLINDSDKNGNLFLKKLINNSNQVRHASYILLRYDSAGGKTSSSFSFTHTPIISSFL
jgi:hypothetical protein